MKIILAPAKKMKVDNDTFATTTPKYLKKTEQLVSYLQSLSFEECQTLWNCSTKIATSAYEQLHTIDVHHNLTPAILAYDGIAFTYMAPHIFTNDEFAYINSHLYILSGLYGALRPLDGIVPYRLEMQAKTKIEGKNLYQFWADDLYREVIDESHILINLASKEYAKAILPYIQKNDHIITCDFKDDVNGKLKTKGVYAKMARGEMVRFMASRQIEDPNDLKDFHELGFHYSEHHSNDHSYVFIRNPSI